MPHFTPQEIEAYHRRRLTPTGLVAVSNHAVECDSCRKQLVRTRPSPATVAASLTEIFGSEHLPYEMISGYVDGELDLSDRESVEAHLAICDHCRSQIDDLRAFKAEAAVPSNESAPAASLWERFLILWNEPSRWIPLSLATAVVLLLLAFIIPGMFSRPPQPQVGRASAPGAATSAASPGYEIASGNSESQPHFRDTQTGSHQAETSGEPIIRDPFLARQLSGNWQGETNPWTIEFTEKGRVNLHTTGRPSAGTYGIDSLGNLNIDLENSQHFGGKASVSNQRLTLTEPDGSKINFQRAPQPSPREVTWPNTER